MSPAARHGPSTRRTSLLSELVGINSVNPIHAGQRSGPGGEAELAHHLAERADRLGAAVTLDEVEPGRPNLYARFPGATDRTVAVDVHLDTVGVEHMAGDPFDGRVADGRVYGRGSVDTKATLAVLLPILEDAVAGRFDLQPTLLLVGTVGEEAGGFPGAYRFGEWVAERGQRLDSLVVAEPTRCAPVHGHKGGLGMEIAVHGRAAHSSKPELGANAIAAAARVVTALEEEGQRLATGPPTAMGTGTLSVTEIAGGRARNIIPDECRLHAGRRTVPGEDPDETFDRLRALAKAAAAPLEIAVELTNGRASGAFYRSPDCELVRQLAEAAGTEPQLASYGSNALAYADVADRLVVFGPGSIDQAHMEVEWVAVDELDRADGVYRTWLSRPVE